MNEEINKLTFCKLCLGTTSNEDLQILNTPYMSEQKQKEDVNTAEWFVKSMAKDLEASNALTILVAPTNQ